MAKRPAGPTGNAPRDVRDDFVGVPADPIKAGPPPRWPPNPKRVKGNTFHSKVTGAAANKRADRAAHFRKGGWVSARADGGVIAKRDELPGEQKNDPFAAQNLKKRRGGEVTESGYKRGGTAKK